MNKILTVARAEYLIAVTSKAFILGVVMMPVFMGGAFLVQFLVQDQVDVSARKIAVVDKTDRLMDTIEAQASVRNQYQIFKGEGEERTQTQAEFLVEAVGEASEGGERLDVVLSKRVSDGELFAFAIIDEGVFEADQDAAIRYYSETPSYTSLSNWLGRIVNDEIKRNRSEELGLSPENVQSLSMSTPVRQFGLVEETEDGVLDAEEENRILTFAVPFAGLMLMFMMVMSVAPAMLNNVLEEKMQKIAEFLVSSITPFQLMLGKLIGAIGIGLTLSTIYLGAAFSMAVYFDVASDISPMLYVWFVFFLVIALVMYGSIFSAIGAACSEIRDAQSLMTPIMILVVVPMMCIAPIFDSPSSTFSRAISLFPPATPMLMFARIAIPPGPETWEVILAAVLTVTFALACVWTAGKIFRIGILSQGQAPSVAKLVGWVLSKQ